jgi:hypothetical protein
MHQRQLIKIMIEIKTGFGYWVKVNADYPGFAFREVLK